MKKRRLLLPMLAVLFAIAASAFTVVKDSTTYYYRYSQTGSGGLLNEDNFDFIGESPSSTGCNEGDINCVIALGVAPDMNGHPDFSSAGISDQEDLDAVTVFWKE